MKRGFVVALVLAGCLAAGTRTHAQAQAGGNGVASGQSKPDGTQPAGQGAGANPFPEDTSTVPVLPAKTAPGLPEGGYNGTDSGSGSERMALPGGDSDPVRSPDDPETAPGTAQEEGSSSSLAGLDKLLPTPDDEETDKKGKHAAVESSHKETSQEDLQVGEYYLETRNWKAALSRLQSALVLAPDNPDVYWGLAEAERHLGDFADARAHYQTVVDYDPNSKHGKEARKALKEPEIANAKAASAQPAGETPKQ